VFKRLFWLSTGAAAGFGGSYWIQRRVKQAVDRLAPASVQDDLKAAVVEGRIAMRTREIELRRRYSPAGRQPAHR
jgi:hypothetical protein